MIGEAHKPGLSDDIPDFPIPCAGMDQHKEEVRREFLNAQWVS